MKIKVIETAKLTTQKEKERTVIDIKIIEGDNFLVNQKYISDNNNYYSFTILSIGRYNPSVLGVYPCEVKTNENLSDLKNKIFILSK